MRAIVVYDSKYGNCKRIAEEIAHGIIDEEKDATVVHVGGVDLTRLAEYDIIVLGAPVRAGKPLRSARKFAEYLSRLPVERKTFAFFETRGGPEGGRGIGALEKAVAGAVAQAKFLSPGFSARVTKMRGPLEDGALEGAREFGKRIAGTQDL